MSKVPVYYLNATSKSDPALLAERIAELDDAFSIIERDLVVEDDVNAKLDNKIEVLTRDKVLTS